MLRDFRPLLVVAGRSHLEEAAKLAERAGDADLRTKAIEALNLAHQPMNDADAARLERSLEFLRRVGWLTK
jgi:hypothetical protein